jgi:hypothetical protein
VYCAQLFSCVVCNCTRVLYATVIILVFGISIVVLVLDRTYNFSLFY